MPPNTHVPVSMSHNSVLYMCMVGTDDEYDEEQDQSFFNKVNQASVVQEKVMAAKLRRQGSGGSTVWHDTMHTTVSDPVPRYT